MSHTKYHTEAVVLRSSDTGEADKYISFLTRDFGLVGVHVRGVRKISSKQRTFLQNLSPAKISLIKGRSIWRLAHVEAADKAVDFADTFEKRNLTSRIFKILTRFVRGEEPNETLFNAVKNGLEFTHGYTRKDEEIRAAESLVVLRIFYILGYVAATEKISPLLHDTSSYNAEILSWALQNINEMDSHIYNAIEESGL